MIDNEVQLSQQNVPTRGVLDFGHKEECEKLLFFFWYMCEKLLLIPLKMEEKKETK